MDPIDHLYAPPSSPLEGGRAPAALPLRLVGSGRRFIHFLIDNLVCYALQFGFGLLVVLAFPSGGAEHLKAGCTASLYGIFLTVAYYSLMEYRFGFTLGKLVTGSRVVTETGEPITFAKALGRSFSRYIPFEPFSCFGSESRGWHDSLAKTCVVRRADA